VCLAGRLRMRLTAVILGVRVRVAVHVLMVFQQRLRRWPVRGSMREDTQLAGAKTLGRPRYSYLRASIGLRAAALRAG
jgi:hypothetical protein